MDQSLGNNGPAYLDVSKSVIISSPAGSGKTEKLARRYISLLDSGAEVQRILCITFTEKAAAEMKQRILGVLERESPERLADIRREIPLMRISTIHSFCLKLLKRFSAELGMDPSLDVMDELAAATLWSEAVYEGLVLERDKPALFFEVLSGMGVKGWDSLLRLLDEVHSKRPYPELMLSDGMTIEGAGEKRTMAVYSDCLKRYQAKKTQRRLLDFNDLELLAYRALSSGGQWQNILYAFDEHTDHVLVDEFQDTSTLQWKIIDKLTEEWRSGMGAKREAGKTPTIFLVGDEKQSIYLFRGANVSVFHGAKQRFSEWLGTDYVFEEIRENFRSLPGIVAFANSLFEAVMAPDLTDSWRTRYSPFEAVRTGGGDGKGETPVEILLLDQGDESSRQLRVREAAMLAKNIRALKGSRQVYEGDTKRPCGFSDMAVLLKRRTHLIAYEDALRRQGVPFVVMKGIGFYDEPETAVLREFVSFMVDPTDRYSLFCLLRSPLFSVPDKTLFKLAKSKEGLLEAMAAPGASGKLRQTAGMLLVWQASGLPLSRLIERMLVETNGWGCFWERQRRANVKKFIAMVEASEQAGLSPVGIREKLLRESAGMEKISKANVNAEAVDAVRIMTVHAAKGLQFPMVFVPSLDEGISPGRGVVVMDDTEEDGIVFKYEKDSAKRKKHPDFIRRRQKEEEEEKRLFYVAVTRARDYLCLLGKPPGKSSSWMSLLGQAFGRLDEITQDEIAQDDNTEGRPFEVLSEIDVDQRSSALVAGIELSDPGTFMDAPAYVDPIKYEPLLKWRTVTGDMDDEAEVAGHGEDWKAVGRVMHQILEELSKGLLGQEEILKRAQVLTGRASLDPEAEGKALKVIAEDFEKLDASGLMKDIVLERENSFSELPFNYQKGKSVFKGRMDRVVLTPTEALVYDYKTFPIRKSEMPGLLQKYSFQMAIYREAAGELFPGRKARAFLLFTHTPELVEM